MEGIRFHITGDDMLNITLKQKNHGKGGKFCFPFETNNESVGHVTEFQREDLLRLNNYIINYLENQGKEEVYQGMMEIPIDESCNEYTRGVLREGLSGLTKRNKLYLDNLEKRFAAHKNKQEPIRDNLDKIMKGLGTYMSQVANYDCFQSCFCFFAASREINRSINCDLALELIDNVNMALSLDTLDHLFEEENVKDMREKIAERFEHKRDYVARGINSKELNKAIKEARKIIIEEKDEKVEHNTHKYQQLT